MAAQPPAGTAAFLVAVTEEARAALGDRAEVRITQFPFKVGRESRSPNVLTRVANEIERRVAAAPSLNDVYLLEPPSSSLLQISREHCAIEYVDGHYFLIERGSACGTIVAGTHLGRNRTAGRTPLQPGDTIVIGTTESPYVFRFHVSIDPGRDPELTSVT
ncbi:MAG: FHA domain-containing protein [bacterium]|nr:FHA domain-containing protein [bacterium]